MQLMLQMDLLHTQTVSYFSQVLPTLKTKLHIALTTETHLLVTPLMVQQLLKTDRDCDPHALVFAACLQQQNLSVWVHGKAVRQDASGRTSADDNVVICHAKFPHLI